MKSKGAKQWELVLKDSSKFKDKRYIVKHRHAAEESHTHDSPMIDDDKDIDTRRMTM